MIVLFIYSRILLSLVTEFLNFLYPVCRFFLNVDFLRVIVSFSLRLHFLFSLSVPLYLCSLVVLSVGCSYSNLTLILYIGAAFKTPEKRGNWGWTEIKSKSAKEQSHKCDIKSRVDLLCKVTWLCKHQQLLNDYPQL